MRRVTVEWLHLDVDGATCSRCGSTGVEVAAAVEGLRRECAPAGVEVRLVETRLDRADIARSNLVLVNGVPVEELVPGAGASTSACGSCGEFTGREESCRTVVQFGAVHETVPRELVREAVCRVAECCPPAGDDRTVA